MTLTLLQLRFEFVAITPLQLPKYNSPTWRGWLGHALRDTPIYQAFFEGKRPQDSQLFAGNSHIPQPYVVVNDANTSGVIEPGQVLNFNLTLFGEAWRVLPVLVPAIHQASEHLYLGKGEGTIALQEVYYRWNPLNQWQVLTDLNIQPPGLVVPPQPNKVRLEILTPMRLLQNKQPLKAHQFNWDVFVRSLVRRISSLEYFHQNIEQNIDFKNLFSKLQSQKLSEFLHNETNKRYSNRQQKYIPLDGLKGHIDIVFTQPNDPLWSWLWLGQFTHNSKAAVMGLGQYQLT